MNRILLILHVALLSFSGCGAPPFEVVGKEEESTGSSTENPGANPDPSTTSSGSGSSSGSASGSDLSTSSSTTDADEDASTGETVSMPSPIAMWLFDGNAREEVSKLDGIVEGELRFETMGDSHGLRFDGTGYLDLSAAGALYRGLLSAGTVTMRIRADTWNTPRNTLLALGAPSPDPSDNVFILRVDDGEAELYMETGDSVEEFFQFGDPPSPQQWHRVTFVLDGTEISYYVDGVEQGSILIPEPDTLSETLNFGIWSGGNYFYGLLDELALYGETLTDQQVAALGSSDLHEDDRDESATPGRASDSTDGVR